MDYTWQYYDLLLLGVVASMGAGAAVAALTLVAATTSVFAAGLVAVALIGHGLFVNGPVGGAEDLTDVVEALN
ncbi:hypothetical protein C475_08001 [Halosimplex carlsbadense 2-9-1]|uniref:Uncharacterized protein n=1 Tax=Halosimplex carlsbadense 2-9-1 TaxID=797114 RepID=M0CUF0_9EURY|nr:hypothetical protein [Halosimplex carlsbadense]ELZ26861.1 hypothetical protein C475_08001 [Halosimplex carlsbadense 2-9-1]